MLGSVSARLFRIGEWVVTHPTSLILANSFAAGSAPPLFCQQLLAQPGASAKLRLEWTNRLGSEPFTANRLPHISRNWIDGIMAQHIAPAAGIIVQDLDENNV